jgi:HD-GYP domain-containing protein (c-di-GMP phosphodiesterase class II)
MSNGLAAVASTPTAASERRRLALAVLKALFAAWRAAAVYDENNNAYRTRRAELADALTRLFAGDADCRIVYQNDYFFFNGERLNYDREFSFGRALASRFGELGLGGLTILADTPPDHIDQALSALAQADRRLDKPYDALAAAWSALKITGVSFSPLLVHGSHLPSTEVLPADPRETRRRRALALFQRSEAVVQEFWERVRDRNSFDSSTVQRIVHQLIDEVASDEEVLLEFAALKDFDEYTYYHSVNVAIYVIAVGMRLGLDRVRLTHLGLSALFHDIGKVKLPRDLITKPEEFDDEDWLQIKRHPALGALTLASLRPFDAQVGTAMAGAFEHHLRMDLTGYPALTRPRTLHLFSRIITLCDSFDAMTSGRVYQRVAIGPDEAVRRLLYQGRAWYDPLVLKAFVHVVGVFPVGTLGRLSDGSLAVVTRNDPADLYAPEVLVIRDAEGEPARRSVRLNASDKTPAAQHLHLVEVLDPTTMGIRIGDYIGLIYHPDETVDVPAAAATA